MSAPDNFGFNPITGGTESRFGQVVLFVGVVVLSFQVLRVSPPWLLSGAGLMLIGFSLFVFAALLAVLASGRGRTLAPAKIRLRFLLALWWSLLVASELFYRFTPESESYAGQFSDAAYGEAAFWGVAFLALLLVVNRQDLSMGFSGTNKWLSLFALVAFLSAPFSPTPLYSLAWAFKLVLVLGLLLVCSVLTRDLGDVQSFFWSSFWGFAVLTLVPVARAFLNPEGAFEKGRLWGSPNGLSLVAGTFVLMALLLNLLRKRIWLVASAVVGSAVMIMAGGKAGIGAGVLSIAVFYMLQKRRAAAVGSVLGILGLACVILLTTPLATHFVNYAEEGYLATLTGRTELWQAAWPEIKARPILGRGYLASRFLSEQVEGAFGQAGHMHNGFLEALYNNGIVGLVILMAMHLGIIKNLLRAMNATSNQSAHALAIGCWAIYVHLLVNGLFNASFGGAARPPFMLFLGLLVVSDTLRRGVLVPVGHTRRQTLCSIPGGEL